MVKEEMLVSVRYWTRVECVSIYISMVSNVVT
jgi:hypothetical protein